MASKFIAGILAGTVVSGVGLGAASLMTEMPGARAPQAGQPTVPAGSEFNQSRDDEEATVPAPEDTTETADAPNLQVPESDDLSGLQGADTTSGEKPETGVAEGDLTAPEVTAGATGMQAATDDPVLPSPQSAAPEAPEGEAELSISTEPAQPSAPEPSGEDSAFPDAAEGSFPSEELADAATAPATSDSPEPSALPSDTTEPGTAPEPSAQTPDTEAGEQDIAVLEEEAPEEAEEEADEPTGTIGNLAQNVETGRLPSVDSETAEESGEQAEEEADLPAIEAHAAAFDNPENKPLMSIVLIDDGSSAIGLDALAAFPYPLSFAVDPTDNGAAEAMRRYRAAGFEVLVLADLPAGASAADTETAMQAILNEVPEAVAVMEGTSDGVQSSRAAAEQLAPILLEGGHGLVLFPKGLDTTGKLIKREGVPTGTVFRDFDGKGQNATVIRRFLDQAAFKAGRDEDGVIMLGRLRAETVSALLIWGLQDRASQVALSPVSAVLTGE